MIFNTTNQKQIDELNSNLTVLENAKVVYNESTDSLDVYSNGVIVGSLPCGFQFDGRIYENNTVYAPLDNNTRTLGSGFTNVGTFNFTTNGIVPSVTVSTNGQCLTLVTTNKLNLSNYSTLTVEAYDTNNNFKTVSLDVSAINQSAYVDVVVVRDSNNTYIRLYASNSNSNFADNYLTRNSLGTTVGRITKIVLT